MAAIRASLSASVFVGLTFDVTPFPGVLVGRADECSEAMRDGKIVDPTRGPTGFHDDQIDFVVLEMLER